MLRWGLVRLNTSLYLVVDNDIFRIGWNLCALKDWSDNCSCTLEIDQEVVDHNRLEELAIIEMPLGLHIFVQMKVDILARLFMFYK